MISAWWRISTSIAMKEDKLSSNSPTKPRLWMLPSRKLWPVYLCWLLMMVATAVDSYLHEFTTSALVMSAMQGVFLGEFALAAIIGGLYGRTWIAGWLVAVFLTCFATVICYCVDFFAARYSPFASDYSRLVLCSFWPLLMLSVCAPMIAMRGLRGWSLTLAEDTAIPKQTSTVEDLLLLSLIVARSTVCREIAQTGFASRVTYRCSKRVFNSSR